MAEVNIFRIAASELFTQKNFSRIPEPDLVMESAEQVRAYTEAGREAGVMAPVYLHHCSHVCDVIRPGDTVVDLACGPATQLGLVARLNPETRFIGVDLSDEMLAKADAYVRAQALENIELRKGDVSRLDMFEDRSIDAVMSTMALHHLPETVLLDRTFSEVARILKKDGGIFIADFGRLKLEKSMTVLANQYAEIQPDIFTLDYLNSMKAAFSAGDFRHAMAVLGSQARLYTVSFLPYMLAVKSAPRRSFDRSLHEKLQALHTEMPGYHQKDFKNLCRFFRFGGLRGIHTPA